MNKLTLIAMSGFLVVQSVPPPQELFEMIQAQDPDLAPGQAIDIDCTGRDSEDHSFAIMGDEPVSHYWVMSTTTCARPPGYFKPF